MSRGPQPRSGARNNYTSANTVRAALPAVLDVPQAARLLGIGRTLAYELVRTEQWPTPVIRVGPSHQNSLCTSDRTHVNRLPDQYRRRLMGFRACAIKAPAAQAQLGVEQIPLAS